MCKWTWSRVYISLALRRHATAVGSVQCYISREEKNFLYESSRVETLCQVERSRSKFQKHRKQYRVGMDIRRHASVMSKHWISSGVQGFIPEGGWLQERYGNSMILCCQSICYEEFALGEGRQREVSIGYDSNLSCPYTCVQGRLD